MNSSKSVRAVKSLACFALTVISLASTNVAHGQDVLRVYGPGGPAPAMKEAAATFGKKQRVMVEVTAGPTSDWLGKARQDADVIYSGSETMMTDFTVAMEGRISPKTITPLYLRPLAILVRPGNPKRITGFTDLLKPGTTILVVWPAGRGALIQSASSAATSSPTRKTVPKHAQPGLANRRSTFGSSGTSGKWRTPSLPIWYRSSRTTRSSVIPA